MSAHHCHAMKCAAPCPPKYLMCGRHWAMVPKPMQDEVYRTVKLRARLIDSSWAPWWRAAHKAIYHVGKAEYPEWTKADAWLAMEERFADQLEGKGQQEVKS